MDFDLKIGAVFSLAPEDVSAKSADETHDAAEAIHGINNETSYVPNEAVDTALNTAESGEYTEMTADDLDISAVSQKGTNDVLTGADPEMNSSTEANDLDIDVEGGDMSTDSAFSPDSSADNPPVLPMEENVGLLSSVYSEEMVETLPPPVLSPVTNESALKRVKEEPVEYDAAYEWTPAVDTSSPPVGDIKLSAVIEPKKKCTKIYPCYIVLTDISPLIGKAYSISCRFMRGLKRTECPNMCKKVYFRRRLKAGRNVFNVKTPSFLAKRLKHLQKIGEQNLSPKSKAEFTRLKYPGSEVQLTEDVVYPDMFLTKTGVKYSFDQFVEKKKKEISAMKKNKIEIEKGIIDMQVKKEKDEIRMKEQNEGLKGEEQKDKEELVRGRELKRQHNILIEQINIKREENFHKKTMRKKKLNLPYFKAGVSARSGRVIKPNSMLTDNLFAFNQSDIHGYRKLSALQEKQRKVLAEMKERENKAKRVNRIIVSRSKVPNRGINLEGLFRNVLTSKQEKEEEPSVADLEIDNPEKEDGVRKFEANGSSKQGKKRKSEVNADKDMLEPVKKKTRKPRQNSKSDRVLISDIPDSRTVMAFLQSDSKQQWQRCSSISSQVSRSNDNGAESVSDTYPNARSLLKASKECEQNVVKRLNPDLMKGVMVIDAKKQEPVRFQVGSKELMMAKFGEKLVFCAPSALQRTINSNTTKNNSMLKATVKTEPVGQENESTSDSKFSVTTDQTAVVTVSNAANSVTSVSKSNLQTTTITSGVSVPVSEISNNTTSVTPNIISIPIPLVSVPSTFSSLVTVPASQTFAFDPSSTKPTLIVNPAIRSLYSSAGLTANNLQSPQTLVSTKPTSSMTSSTSTLISSTSLSKTSPTSQITKAVTGTAVSQPLAFTLFSTPTSSLVPLPNSVAGPSLASKPQKASNGTPSVSAQVTSSKAAATDTQPKAILTPVSKLKSVTTAITPTQPNSAPQKGKFYLLKVDGKHILIPVPNPADQSSTVQAKAYLVNDLPGLSKAGSASLRPVTPLPTQTVQVPLATHTKQNVNVPVVARNVSTSEQIKPVNIPFQAFKVSTSQSKPTVTTLLPARNINASQSKQTAVIAPVHTQDCLKIVNSQSKQTVNTGTSLSKTVIITLPAQGTSTSRTIVSSPVVSKPYQTIVPHTANTPIMSNKVLLSGNFPGGGPKSIVTKEADLPKTELNVSKVPKVLTYVQQGTSLVVTVTAPISYSKPISSISPVASVAKGTTISQATSGHAKPCTVSLLSSVTSSFPKVTDKPTDNALSVVRQVVEVAADERDKNASGFVSEKNETGNLKPEKNNAVNVGDNTEGEKRPVKEDPEAKPFSEVITDREERLRKLKELLKQKKEAVEQIRLNLNKTTSLDEAETSVDGAEV